MSTPLVYFPDIEAVLIGHLSTELALLGFTSAVYNVVPDADQGRPDRFVLVRRTGGARRSKVTEDAQVTVEGWGDTAVEAHDLLQAARAVLHAARGTAVDGVPIYRVAELAGPAFLPDPDSRQARYTATFLIHVRGSTTSS